MKSGEHMDEWNETVFDLLEQNAKWWEEAAVTCEHIASHNGLGGTEDWRLMGAIYRERAQKHAQFIEQLRRNGTPPGP